METLLLDTDVTLWNALRLMQASGLSPLRLDSSQALTTALEQAGGQQPDEGSGSGLMDRVRDEYDKYFTPGGSERRNVFADRDELENIRSALAEAQHKLAEVDDVVASLSRINEQISHDRTVVAAKKADYQQAETDVANLADLEKEVEVTRHAASEATQRQVEAKSAHDTRAKLVDNLATAQSEDQHCQQVLAELSVLSTTSPWNAKRLRRRAIRLRRSFPKPRRLKPKPGRPLQQRELVNSRPGPGNNSIALMSSRSESRPNNNASTLKR